MTSIFGGDNSYDDTDLKQGSENESEYSDDPEIEESDNVDIDSD